MQPSRTRLNTDFFMELQAMRRAACRLLEKLPPELHDDPRFLTNTDRVAHRAELKAAIEAVFQSFTVEELTVKAGLHV